MHRIGLVDLDSSHPDSFTKAIREDGRMDVVAVCDGGDVRPPGYAETFAAERGIPFVGQQPEDLLGRVDAVMILSVNWDKHLERARPFLEAGVPVFVDKPVFGRLRDGYEMQRLAEASGGLLMGGSGVRYDESVLAMRDSLGDRSALDSGFACGPGTFFYYGIHTVETIHTVLGGGPYKVRRAGEEKELFELVYREGPTIWLRLECARPLHFALFARNKPARVLGPQKGYMNFLKALTDLIETRQPAVPFKATLETTALMIAIGEARTATGWVRPDEVGLDDGPDGAAFAQWYRLH